MQIGGNFEEVIFFLEWARGNKGSLERKICLWASFNNFTDRQIVYEINFYIH